MGGSIKTRDMRNPRYRDEVAQTEGVISVWATWLRTDKGSGQREERTPGKRSQGRDRERTKYGWSRPPEAPSRGTW